MEAGMVRELPCRHRPLWTYLHLWAHDKPVAMWNKLPMEETDTPDRTGGNDPVRVMLADDHSAFREGLKEMLLTDDGIEVVAEAEDGARAIEIARQARPDVVVLDLAMPVMDGKEALGPILRNVSPPPGVVILTMYDEVAQRRELLEMGASAFLAKSASLAEILATVKGASPKGGGTRGA